MTQLEWDGKIMFAGCVFFKLHNREWEEALSMEKKGGGGVRRNRQLDRESARNREKQRRTDRLIYR